MSQLKTNVQQIKVKKILNYKNIDLSIIKHNGNPANTKGEHPMIGLTSNYNLFTAWLCISLVRGCSRRQSFSLNRIQSILNMGSGNF